MSNRNISVESALARLEKIADLLEKGDLTLDDSLKLYEEGVSVIRLCKDKMKKAELKISEITEAFGKDVKQNESVESDNESI